MSRYRRGWEFKLAFKKYDKARIYQKNNLTADQAQGLIHLLNLLEKLGIVEYYDFYATEDWD